MDVSHIPGLVVHETALIGLLISGMSQGGGMTTDLDDRLHQEVSEAVTSIVDETGALIDTLVPTIAQGLHTMVEGPRAIEALALVAALLTTKSYFHSPGGMLVMSLMSSLF
jgi:hypothetical protein